MSETSGKALLSALRRVSLSLGEKAELISRLLEPFPGSPSGPDDAEVARRVEEMDSGEVIPITHEQFLTELGRG